MQETKEALKKTLLKALKNIGTFLKWMACACVVGVVVGLIGTLFHFCMEFATEFRGGHDWIILLLPAAGVAIAFLYQICGMAHDKGTNLVLTAVRSDDTISIKTAPLVFIGTFLTHLFGGSSGREGAALQLGGSLSSQLGRWIHLDEKDSKIMTMCGMSAAFSALFGSPLAAAVFSMEVISVGVMYYAAIVPCVISSVIGFSIAQHLGVVAVDYEFVKVPPMELLTAGKVVVLAILCAALSILFCMAMHQAGRLFKRFFKNKLLRAAVGGAVIVALTFALGTRDYNGPGMDIIVNAMNGEARPEAFFLKIVFTAVTLGCGFKGGEIVPSFFVGATFGCVMGGLLGLPPAFAAAVGLIALFCGVINCPVTSLILSIELFGAEGMLYFAMAGAVSYMLSGYYGLYSGQKILYSKMRPEFINKDSK